MPDQWFEDEHNVTKINKYKQGVLDYLDNNEIIKYLINDEKMEIFFDYLPLDKLDKLMRFIIDNKKSISWWLINSFACKILWPRCIECYYQKESIQTVKIL